MILWLATVCWKSNARFPKTRAATTVEGATKRDDLTITIAAIAPRTVVEVVVEDIVVAEVVRAEVQQEKENEKTDSTKDRRSPA